VNWFAGQHRLKIKSARSIAENRLTAGTKFKIEQFSKTFQDLIKSSVFKDVNRPIAIAKCPSMQCFRSWLQQTRAQQARVQASVDRIVRSCPFVPVANVANSQIRNHHSFSNREIWLVDQISVNARRKESKFLDLSQRPADQVILGASQKWNLF
jgi:hypothetical protein